MYQLIVDSPGDQTYSGKAEICTYEFSTLPEQVPGESWLAERIINATNDQLLTQNSRLLYTKIWRDTTPTWVTNYRVEVTASASPLFWQLIILGVVAVVALILTWRIISIVERSWGKFALPVTAGAISLLLLGLALIILPRGRT